MLSKRILVVTTVLAVTLFSKCSGSNDTVSSEPLIDSLESALEPLYGMVDGFLRVVYPNELDLEYISK